MSANRYAGKGACCGAWIEAEAGVLVKDGGRWTVRHDGECPEAPPAPANAEPGYYTSDGKIIVVVRSKNTSADRTYGKVLTGSKTEDGKARWSWEYQAGLGLSVAHLTPVSLEDAAAWGVMHGTCLVCCRRLTTPESVQRGIGPVCAKRFT